MKTFRVQNLCAATLVGALIGGLTQDVSFAQAPAMPAAAVSSQASLKAEQVDQLLAPIALYPDALLAQVLMASTYPLEIVQAARWVKSNPGRTGKALEDALQTQTWDPSVKSLAAVPQVLQMMDEKLEWVQRVGDAFLAQREDVMNGVQRLRAKASAAGKLQTTKEQKVTTQAVASKTVIVIQPANPQTVYVPVYNPAVVYGAWPYPAYPPYPYYPAGYAVGTALAFTTGVAVGAALWGNVNWGNNNVNINVNQFNSYNRTNISNTNWQHDAGHRKGVPYRDAGVAQQYGRSQANTASRDDFRGRTNVSPSEFRGTQPGDRSRDGGRPAGASASPAGSRPGGPSTRPAPTSDFGSRGGRADNAFTNVDRGGAARVNADRGRASMGGGASLGGGGRQGGGVSPRGGGGAPAARGGGRRR
jgi:hypothetical protein